MAKRKSQDNLRVSTQVLPVVSCSDIEQLTRNHAIVGHTAPTDITRYMPYREVTRVLIVRTVLFLASIGVSVTEALNLGWLQSKFSAEALEVEARETTSGVEVEITSLRPGELTDDSATRQNATS